MEAEITEIFGHLGKLIKAHREMGLEPPPLSDGARGYLGVTKYRVNAAEAGAPVAGRVAPELGDREGRLKALRASIGECRRCKLHKERTNLVFGEGSPRAELIFVGEGPGQEEDMAGRPFVGEAGRLLTRIIENGMGLLRKEVYICNVVKCRPPRNRDPEMDEIKACMPFLEEQLEIIRPKVFCTLGRVAAQCLIGPEFKISVERGTWHSYNGIPLMPTYHPAYLLRYPAAKRRVWEDIKKVMGHLGLEVKKNV
ncbi:MAG: uracil-DNA glycosylase [Pseudomonadota bacterium]